LIVIDINLPGDMDGVDLAHSVRSIFAAIPVILISGYGGIGSLETARFPFIPKPFVPKTMLDAVDRVMGVKQS
jgi:two-component system, NtrC family, sensor kinase